MRKIDLLPFAIKSDMQKVFRYVRKGMNMPFLGQDIPKLGFGLMRLPLLNNEDPKSIDIEQLKQMVDDFLEDGFTYFDTAYLYHQGCSETAIKEALIDRHPRDSFQLATKLPAWVAGSEEEAQGMLQTSLERTGAGYFDYYLLHNLGENRSAAFDKYSMWDYLAKKKEEGIIRHLGFSMHDKAAVLEAILDAHPEMDFVQLQINYADWDDPAVEARKCYEVARDRNIPIIIMEPVKGGTLSRLPQEISALLTHAEPGSTEASWALRYAASLDGIITVLSGMSTIEQLRENIKTMENFVPLNPSEQAVIEEVRAKLATLPDIPCTDCRYCVEPCPQGIRIPAIMSELNIYLRFNDLIKAREGYGWLPEEGRASNCIQCGICEAACPQHIPIISELERAVKLFEK